MYKNYITLYNTNIFKDKKHNKKTPKAIKKIKHEEEENSLLKDKA